MKSPPTQPDPVAHSVMFWLLTGMAIAVFAPCVLVPIWAQTEAVKEHEGGVERIVTGLEEQVAANDARIEALLGDPLANQRMLRRELNHRPEEETVVTWARHELAGVRLNLPEVSAASQAERSPWSPPEWLRAAQRWLPAWPWRKLFAESPNRTLLMFLAGGLLVAAFVLYAPRAKRLSPPPVC